MENSIPKIGAVLQSARELTLEAANAVSARLMDETAATPKDISKFLNSRNDREKLTGLKQVITVCFPIAVNFTNFIKHMSKGNNAQEFFADVIKNIASSNVEIRKLVYVFLVRYADHEPDLALLSINTIQKSLMDENPVIRSLAMRVISGIRVLSIVQIVCLGIKKCSSDPSPIVRRAAAAAISKCYDLDYSNGPQLLDILQKLIADKNPEVVSAALVTLKKSYPDRLDVLHSIYRKLCRMLPSLNEWGQAAALDLLVKYARVYLPRPRTLKIKKSENSFYENKEDYEEFDADDDTAEPYQQTESNALTSSILDIDSDLELLFISARPLLFSRNSSVVIAAAHTYFYLGNHQIFEDYQVAGPVVHLLRNDIPIQYLTLINIKIMALTRRDSFTPFLKHFFLFPSDIFLISKLKLEILTLLCNPSNISMIVSELKYYSLTSNNQQVIEESIQSLGRCITVSPETSSRILRWLLHQAKSNNPALVSQSLNVIRYIILRDPGSHTPTIARLARLLDQVAVDSAKESIIWLVGEFAATAQDIAPDVLRKCAKNFAKESAKVRYQIVLLAAKVFSCYLDRNKPSTNFGEDGEIQLDMPFDDKGPEAAIPKLFSYVMLLARYDTNYDTRDRARMFSTLLTSSASTDMATLLLQAPKPCPVTSLREIMCGTTKQNNKHPKSNDEDFETLNEDVTTEKISKSPAPTRATVVPVIDLLLGSASLALGHPVDGFQSLPDWTPVGEDLPVESSVRDEVLPDAHISMNTSTGIGHIAPALKGRFKSSQSGISNTSFSSQNTSTFSNGGQKFKEQTLDEFFANAPSAEEDSSEEEESSEEESGDEVSSDEDSGEEESEESESGEEESEEEESETEETAKLMPK